MEKDAPTPSSASINTTAPLSRRKLNPHVFKPLHSTLSFNAPKDKLAASTPHESKAPVDACSLGRAGMPRRRLARGMGRLLGATKPSSLLLEMESGSTGRRKETERGSRMRILRERVPGTSAVDNRRFLGVRARKDVSKWQQDRNVRSNERQWF